MLAAESGSKKSKARIRSFGGDEAGFAPGTGKGSYEAILDPKSIKGKPLFMTKRNHKKTKTNKTH